MDSMDSSLLLLLWRGCSRALSVSVELCLEKQDMQHVGDA